MERKRKKEVIGQYSLWDCIEYLNKLLSSMDQRLGSLVREVGKKKQHRDYTSTAEKLFSMNLSEDMLLEDIFKQM